MVILKYLNFLDENCADTHADNDFVIRLSSKYGYFKIVKFLLELNVDIHADNDFALKISSLRGYFDIVKVLIKKGQISTH